MSQYAVVPDPNCARFAPLHGWRALLNKWMRIPFKRPRYVFFAGNGQLICHPDTVPVVRRWLELRNTKYVIAPPKLSAVPRQDPK